MTDAHPMVSPTEKTFVLACLHTFSETVDRKGGFRKYVEREHRKASKRHSGKSHDVFLPLPEELLRKSWEALLQETARHAGDCVNVELGDIQSMGMKKVVKLEVSCEDLDMYLIVSICWDWDVKLEQK